MGNKEVQGRIRLLGTCTHEEAIHQQAVGDGNEASSVPMARSPNKTLSIFQLHPCATGHLVSLPQSQLVMLLLMTWKHQGTHLQKSSDKTTFDSAILLLQ